LTTNEIQENNIKYSYKRYTNGVKKQYYYKRDLTFSLWHRLFVKSSCYTTDIDFLEYRYNEKEEVVIKALIEVRRKEYIKPASVVTSSVEASFYLAKQAGIKLLYILYSEIPNLSRKEEDLKSYLSDIALWLWIPSEEEIKKYKRSTKTPINELFKPINSQELKQYIESL